jgi:hypothetical protein
MTIENEQEFPRDQVGRLDIKEDMPPVWVYVPTGKILLSRHFVPGASTTEGGHWIWHVAAQIDA